MWGRGEGTGSECDRGGGHAHAGIGAMGKGREVQVGGWRCEEARGARAGVGQPARGEGAGGEGREWGRARGRVGEDGLVSTRVWS